MKKKIAFRSSAIHLKTLNTQKEKLKRKMQNKEKVKKKKNILTEK